MTLNSVRTDKPERRSGGAALVRLGFEAQPARLTRGGSMNRSDFWFGCACITINSAWVQEGIRFFSGLGLGNVSRNKENVCDSDFQYFHDPRKM